jgi:phage tail protein X
MQPLFLENRNTARITIRTHTRAALCYDAAMLTETIDYATREGDMLDAICAAHYDGSAAMLPAVLALNPGLADMPPQLPSGVIVVLPPGANPVLATRRLWD